MSFCCPIHGYYAPVPGATLALCPSCSVQQQIATAAGGAPQTIHVFHHEPGEPITRHHPDAPFDLYEAVNLLQALKHAPDTGDWNGQLRIRCQAVIDRARERGETIPPPCPWPADQKGE